MLNSFLDKEVPRFTWRAVLLWGGLSPFTAVMAYFIFNAEGAAAWVQAFGSIVAIFAAIGIASAQRSAERDYVRTKETVVVRVVEHLATNAYSALWSLDADLMHHYRPIPEGSAYENKVRISGVSAALRDLEAINLLDMNNRSMVEAVIELRVLIQMCLDKAVAGYDPEKAMLVNEFRPLKWELNEVKARLTTIRSNL